MKNVGYSCTPIPFNLYQSTCYTHHIEKSQQPNIMITEEKCLARFVDEHEDMLKLSYVIRVGMVLGSFIVGFRIGYNL